MIDDLIESTDCKVALSSCGDLSILAAFNNNRSYGVPDQCSPQSVILFVTLITCETLILHTFLRYAMKINDFRSELIGTDVP